MTLKKYVKALKPSSRSLFQVIESARKLTYMIRLGRINIPSVVP